MKSTDIEIYVHIPFCIRKCAYCDFLSGPSDDATKEAYVEAVLREIDASEDMDCKVTSVFFGGGTPSVLPAEALTRILKRLQSKYNFCEDAEISLEANPGTVDKEKLEQYRAAGFNRISFGCQSMEDDELRRLGRIHTVQEFLTGYEWAQEAGFTNINVDLMSGLPGQTFADWERNLRQVADLNPTHISAYSLILEEGTPFFEKMDQLNLPDEEIERLMYEKTHEILAEYGYQQYEISNYAKPGYACRHNVGYWKRVPYLGIGLGAASLMEQRVPLAELSRRARSLATIFDVARVRILPAAFCLMETQFPIRQETRYSNTSDMKEYLQHSHDLSVIRKEKEMLSTQAQMEEFMILGLRMCEGVSEAGFAQLFGKTLDEVYGEVIDKYCKMGLLQRQEGYVSFTRKGISVSNTILAEFLE